MNKTIFSECDVYHAQIPSMASRMCEPLDSFYTDLIGALGRFLGLHPGFIKIGGIISPCGFPCLVEDSTRTVATISCRMYAIPSVRAVRTSLSNPTFSFKTFPWWLHSKSKEVAELLFSFKLFLREMQKGVGVVDVFGNQIGEIPRFERVSELKMKLALASKGVKNGIQ